MCFQKQHRSFLGYVREKACDEFIPNIAADEDLFNKMELHSAL